MNYAAILKELEGAPYQDDWLFEWLWREEREEVRSLLLLGRWRYTSFNVQEELSELAEFCARMVEIEGCRHEGWIRWIFTMVACPRCTAEYRRCDDGVWRWM